MRTVRMARNDGEIVSVPLRADAATPRRYRKLIGRDVYIDMINADKMEAVMNGNSENSNGASMEVFENLAYVMAKTADPEGVTDNIEDWLEQFSMFSIMQIVPIINEMWRSNVASSVNVKKNQGRPTGH